MNNSLNKTRRMAFMISGGIDTLIGAIFLLIGFNLLPIEVTKYGLEKWLAILVGGIFFIVGAGVLAYNLSRLEE